MVELRKRKAVGSSVPAPVTKKPSSVKSASKEKAKVAEKKGISTNGASSSSKFTVGGTIDFDGFGGEVETNDGAKTSLKKLVEDSESGVVLFTYPKASTPGCTTQACLFRDEYDPLTGTGFAIYGLSTDSPKSNTTFKTKQNLPYTLLCDPLASLIAAIGMKKAPKGTTRGVFVVSKEGKVLAAQPGSPATTVDVVRKVVLGGSADPNGDVGEVKEAAEVNQKTEEAKDEAEGVKQAAASNSDEAAADVAADVAAEVADTAQKLDAGVKA